MIDGMVLDNKNCSRNRRKTGGFTLLEMIIVVGIIAVLSAVVIFVLNPAETLKKSRDAQRLSDLATVKTALGLYLISTSTIQLDNQSGMPTCKNSTGNKTLYLSYSSDAPGATSTDGSLDSPNATSSQKAFINLGLTNGNGWIPINLSQLTGGAPISNFPVDPLNRIADVANVTSTDTVYRYMCDEDDSTFEVNADLESIAYETANSVDNKEEVDGGNNRYMLEVGNKLDILNCTATAC
ncbi:MAG: hypothetical protein A2939_04465 [Parcubacteria group bacterium RIFCSPLOWO2_01_FULL_48_18]|nr:MAG: hypothetical protein A3J67_03655 [Parcubacteria group bacterium RIFCSPHIGHO2_02_FULL_48_10b]OHB22633.1 MAG: hypothetical protein A2939_04465 [Parcubacteria group bacterium RIFCSPLOWO2_01_FULL_48_18]